MKFLAELAAGFEELGVPPQPATRRAAQRITTGSAALT